MSSASVMYILDKATAGERLYFDEALQLYYESDLEDLRMAANMVRQMRVPGQVVTYLVDCYISYTNVCTTGCQFCGFYRSPGHPEAHVCSRDELSTRIDALIARGGNRVLMQGGHNPDLTLEWYVDLLHWLREHYPEIERDCFSPSEVAHIARVSNMPVRDVLMELKAAGLQGLPGGGAEILDDEIRDRFSPRKQKADGWLKVMREAQKIGLNTTATMVIGFDETPEHRVRHLQRLRDLQDYSLREEGNGFHAFISWTLYHSEMSSMGRSRMKDNYGATPQDYLRHAAIARLFLDNILHHQASWGAQEPEIAQRSFGFGLDDLGGTMFETHALSTPIMSEGEIHRTIRDAGFTPARRDSAYNILYIFDNPADSPAPVSLTSVPYAGQVAASSHTIHVTEHVSLNGNR